MSVLLYALTSEKAVSGIERENKLTFIVTLDATKKQIREEIEKNYGGKVKAVNTLIMPSGRKKAFVAFVKAGTAAELAAKLKVI